MGKDGSSRHDRGDERRVAARKVAGVGHRYGLIASAQDDIDSARRTLLSRTIPESGNWVKEMSGTVLGRAMYFDDFAKLIAAFELPLEQMRCSDFTNNSGGKVPPGFKKCHNLAELKEAIIAAEEARGKPEAESFQYEDLTWKLHFTKEQYEHIEGYGKKPKSPGK